MRVQKNAVKLEYKRTKQTNDNLPTPRPPTSFLQATGKQSTAPDKIDDDNPHWVGCTKRGLLRCVLTMHCRACFCIAVLASAEGTQALLCIIKTHGMQATISPGQGRAGQEGFGTVISLKVPRSCMAAKRAGLQRIDRNNGKQQRTVSRGSSHLPSWQGRAVMHTA
jgi:hypothetical protein